MTTQWTCRWGLSIDPKRWMKVAEAGRGARTWTVRTQALLHHAEQQVQRRAVKVGVALQE